MLLHADDVHTDTAVAYAVREVCALPAERCLDLARELGESRTAELTTIPDRRHAEEVVRRLQIFGLRATLRQAADV